MTVSSEANRTLVKSPPELWSELSDAESLARHLTTLDGIRITRSEPESAVEWEADGASGSVRLTPSGFGTKVTLSLTRELPVPPSDAAPPPDATQTAAPCDTVETMPPSDTVQTAPPSDTIATVLPSDTIATVPPSEPLPVTDPEPLSVTDPEPLPVTDPEPLSVTDPEPLPVTDPEPLAIVEPRQSFLRRLFKRRKPAPDPTPEPEPREAAVSEPEPREATDSQPAATREPAPQDLIIEPESQGAVSEPEPQPAAVPEPEPEPQVVDVATELAGLEAEMAEQDAAMLCAMLDRLGAAHHRPFSRS